MTFFKLFFRVIYALKTCNQHISKTIIASSFQLIEIGEQEKQKFNCKTCLSIYYRVVALDSLIRFTSLAGCLINWKSYSLELDKLIIDNDWIFEGNW